MRSTFSRWREGFANLGTRNRYYQIKWKFSRFALSPSSILRSKLGAALSGSKKALRVTTSDEWVDYFTENALRQRDVPWHRGLEATPDEVAEIAASLRGWQLGETSDGSHLLRAAKHYAARIGDPRFVDAVQLFIKEEQRHGDALGRFLDVASVPRARFDWGDAAFRIIRYFLPRMEVWATPVVMVETHAMVYYNAIRRSTRSTILRTICEQILADEVPHIRFQCERLAILHRHRGPIFRAMTMAVHRFLFTTITLAVWFGHGRAFRAGGYSFRRFWNSVWRKMDHTWQMMDARRFDWEMAELPSNAVVS